MFQLWHPVWTLASAETRDFQGASWPSFRAECDMSHPLICDAFALPGVLHRAIPA
jgi:hypothetical protein